MSKKAPSNPKVLITAYECAPFFKRGGLGDVMESLPKALSKQKVDIKIVIPYYNSIKSTYRKKSVGKFYVKFGARREEIKVYKDNFPDTSISVYFLANEKYLSSPNIEGKNKRIDEFAFFSSCVSFFVDFSKEHLKWMPDVVHCNDWHTALIPLLVAGKVSTLLTIHNLNYQGVGSLRILELLHMKDEEAREIKTGIPATELNVLGEGIIHASAVNTVSPTYAKEIIDNEASLIHRFIVARKKGNNQDGGISGIINGIDYDIWSPKKDDLIVEKYDISNWREGKSKNRQALLEELGLPDRVTFCFVGRMARQKGLDMLVKVAKRIVELDANLVILGSGSPNIEKSVKKLEQKYPQNIRAEILYSEELAHKIYAGSDFIIIPSRYEPCGLIQMIAMSYGTLPIASKTGGLKDTIKNNSTGFLFEPGHVVGLRKKIKKAVSIVKSDKKKHERMVERAMNADFSWRKSARIYKKLYQEML